MSKKHFLIVLAAMLMMQPAFAMDDMTSDDKPCAPIVKACLDAGYARDGAEGKQFWKDCMKPVVLGKSVADVKVDAKDVKACRADKVKQLKAELNEMKAAK